jgi:hypothetical protein
VLRVVTITEQRAAHCRRHDRTHSAVGLRSARFAANVRT